MRRNPDVDLRELERSAATGDPEAVVKLVRALERSGMPVSYDLRARFFAAEHSGDHLVTYPNGKQRKVTNLGWLRRQLHHSGGMFGPTLNPLRFVVRTLAGVSAFGGEACYLRAEFYPGNPHLADPNPGHVFETMFASCHHLWDWLQSATFEEIPLDWDGRVGVVRRRMHKSTYGHPARSWGGPDAECTVCGRLYWSGDPNADPARPRCPTCFAGWRRRNPDERDRRAERGPGRRP